MGNTVQISHSSVIDFFVNFRNDNSGDESYVWLGKIVVMFLIL